MAEKGSTQGSGSTDGKQSPRLSTEQMELLRRRQEMAQWAKSGKLRTRNVVTGLAIGGIVLGIYGYTFYSVSQEKFLDELEAEAKVVRANYPKTSGN
ncbi:cytochrome c oxidase assembly factor 3 homolog, mitochondrial [Anomaloglossus baeobatrachus]|uniref:cytochrome c oxidase assembly factor 3 homolog, mitochondrial n=1 Tax=Anomaloglossus baeobatrachus TaxID=238106 RepID=UPI003F50759B